MKIASEYDPDGKWCWPDFSGGSVLNLVETLARRLGAPASEGICPLRPALTAAWPDEPPKCLMLLVIDGMGDAFLQSVGVGSALLAHRLGRLSSLFPSTTATVITSFMSGLAPATHGLNGWFVREPEVGGILAPLPLYLRAGARLGGKVDPAVLFPYPSLYQRISAPAVVVAPKEIVGSPFNVHHSRGAARIAYENLDGFVEALAQAAAQGGFVYGYYPGLDATAHDCGIGSEEAREALARVDCAFGRLLERLAGQCVWLLVTADHGFIDSPDARVIKLEDHPGLAGLLDGPLWGERRVSYCALKEGAEAAFLAYVGQHLGHALVAVPCSELLAAGLCGPGPRHPRLAVRMGDYALIARDDWTLRDVLPGEKPHAMLGVHGGLSADEMFVPLIGVLT
ncbi:MAG: alkaline phosphatase family protein [Zoogloea sp.]|nr:alkaline phosphatase family protein [Zoogloea sp.]